MRLAPAFGPGTSAGHAQWERDVAMRFRNPFDVAPIRPAPLPGVADPTGELEAAKPDALLDSECAPPAPAGERLRVEFLGSGAEYARLWYVNLLLTFVTLGIWSAWAKVATRRYFASRTLIGGVPFVYHGEPVPILKGRVLATAILAAGWALSNAMPAMQPVLLALAILAAPWFMLRTLAFDTRNYSWRGLHFGFAAPYRVAVAAILPLLVWPACEIAFRLLGTTSTGVAFYMAEVLLPLAVFGLLWPRTVAAVTRMRFDGTRYGSVQFTLDAMVQDFYRLYFRGLGPVFGVLIFVTGVLAAIASHLDDPDTAALLQAVLYFCTVAIAIGFSRGRRFNLALHRLVGDGRIRFRSTLEPKELSNLYLRNALWTIATLGLATPWRRILTARVRAGHVAVYVEGGFADIHLDASATPGAFGESLAEALNLDVSL